MTVELSPGSTAIIVGPNNSGKTSTLRELSALLAGKGGGPVLKTMEIQKQGDSRDIREWLNKNVALVLAAHGTEKVYSWLGAKCSESGFRNYGQEWGSSHLGTLSQILCSHLPIDRRIEFLESRDSQTHSFNAFNSMCDAPQNPIHVLIKDDRVEKQVCDCFRKAFGMDLILNRGVGTDFPLHCGESPTLEPGEDRVSRGFVDRLSKLPVLSEQGHGMRSFAGCVMATFASPALVQLVDEPEAFLHPPQARYIGRLLTKQKPNWRQLIIATHSGELLRGALDSEVDNLKIIRLSRDRNVNHARQLDVEDIQKLWSDPILRFSNVLDGLFHESVVVCEGDADCRFFAAVLKAIHSSEHPEPDVHFSSTGGKDRLHVVVSSLIALGVPTRVVADFDVLKEEQTLVRIVEALGGDWSIIKKDWLATKNAIEQKAPPLTRNQVKTQVEQIIAASDDRNLTEKEIEKIRNTLRATSSWNLAKQCGVDIVPTGQPRKRLNSLLSSLRSLGLFVVECGELERFAPTVDKHGPLFVAEVLKRDLARDPELASARQFVAELFSTNIKHEASAKSNQSPMVSANPRINRKFHLSQIGHHLACLFGIER
ncbi:MAG: AAA family ATPase [Pirellula sp.]